MTATDVLDKLLHTSLIDANLKYCLVDMNKHPLKLDGTPARPNNIDDFADISNLADINLNDYAGIGISIQASNVCAIDVDHCFGIPNDVSSGDERAKYCLELFKDIAYCEFSFSGTGLRIIFRHPIIENYSNTYYIKNDKVHIEYYQPTKSFRYVTVTGNTIYNNVVDDISKQADKLYMFLNKYMTRQFTNHTVKTDNQEETRSYDELMKLVRKQYRLDMNFQNLWFTHAPGSGKDESERDYHLVAYLYENITQDKNLIKQIFESSEFFKTKDSKHIYKWTYQDGRYFNYLYEQKRRQHA